MLCLCPRPTPDYHLRSLAEAAYREFFYEKKHYNYFNDDPDIGSCIVSIKREWDNTDNYR